MRRPVFCLALLGVLPLMAARGASLPWPLLPLDGTLSGVMHVTVSSPVLTWRVTVRPVDAGALELEFSVEGKDARLRGQAHIDAATDDGTWQVTGCRIDLATWSAALAGKFPALSGWLASGTLTADGHGTVKHGVADGTATLILAGGGLRNDAKKISCSGMAARIVLAGLQPLHAEPGQQLTVQSIAAGGAEVHDVKIPFALAPGEMRVAAAEGTAFGGKFSTKPFVFIPAQSTADLMVQATDLGLAPISAFIDVGQKRVREATGRVSGEFMVHLDHAGVHLGRGLLAMREGESAKILFQPTPGLFTSYLPGNVRGVYKGFEPIELGKSPMLVKKFQVKFYPDGETAQRTARVELEGDSTDPHLPAPIALDLNVDGPLQEAIQRYLALGRRS